MQPYLEHFVMHGAPRNRFSRVPLDSLAGAPLVQAKKHHFGCYIWQLVQLLCLKVVKDQVDERKDAESQRQKIHPMSSAVQLCQTMFEALGLCRRLPVSNERTWHSQ